MNPLLPEREPEWIEGDTVALIHDRQLAEHGGSRGIRDRGLLDSALNRARQLWAFGNPAPDLCAMAAAYACGLTKNHAFIEATSALPQWFVGCFSN